MIVKGGGPLEALARARVVLFDKTGTLTAGRPRLATIDAGPATDRGAIEPGELLRLAASVEQLSPHVLAGSIVHGARERGLELSMPGDVVETPGAGVRASSTAGRSRSGPRPSVPAKAACRAGRATVRRRAGDGWFDRAPSSRVDGAVRGALVLDDPLRSETPRAIRSLRRIGFTRIVMVTGDNAAVADIDRVGHRGRRGPGRPGAGRKVDAVRAGAVRSLRARS